MIDDWVKLTRLSNAVIAGFGVWLGHACLPGPIDWISATLGFLALAFLAAAGNIHNDILDIEADRINRPNRPLPSGRLHRPMAVRAAVAIYLTAIASALFIDILSGLIVAGMALLLILYNLKLKSLPMWGNLAVAVLCALAVYFPEFPGWPIHTGLPALFALLTTLAREIAKDAEDVVGDKAVGSSTFPIRYGEMATRHALRILIIALFLLLPIPHFWLNYHLGYTLLVLVGPVPLLIIMLRSLSQPRVDWSRIQKHWKWIMLAGMAAIFVGINF